MGKNNEVPEEGQPVIEEKEVKPKLTMKKLLTAANIFAADDLKCIDVEVPEWGGTVRMRTLTGEEAAVFIDADKKTSNARMLVMSAIDEEGKPLFTEADIPRLRQRSMKAFMRIQQEGLKLNGINTELDTIVKNV